MAIRVAINRFGRIGRQILRTALKFDKNMEIDFMAINDLADAHTLACLLNKIPYTEA